MRTPADVKILVVDDEEALRKAIVFDFTRKGYTVLEASNGHEAFDIVSRQKLDIILTDVRMPNGDGIELLDRVKAKDRSLPVVMFITGFADISLEDAYDKGVDAVFSKPFDRKALAEAVARATLPLDERWASKRSENRLEVNFNIKLKFPQHSLESSGTVLNIGRGGIFVALDGQFPATNAQADFTIELTEQTLNGSGVVRWVRANGQPDLKSGCGIEFTFLEDHTRHKIVSLINAIKTLAFIPKK